MSAGASRCNFRNLALQRVSVHRLRGAERQHNEKQTGDYNHLSPSRFGSAMMSKPTTTNAAPQ